MNGNNKIKMIQSGIGEHIKNYIQNIYALRGIVISDMDGTHIWNEFGDGDEIEK
jgi:phosphatidate phosphatase PAH1